MSAGDCIICGRIHGHGETDEPRHDFFPSTGNADEDADFGVAIMADDVSARAWGTLVATYGLDRAAAAWHFACDRHDEAQQEDDYARASEDEDAERAERLQAIRISRERAALACSADPVAAAVFYLGVVLEEALLHPTGDFDDLVAGALRRLRVR